MAHGPLDGSIELGGPLVEPPFASPTKPWTKRDEEIFWGVLLTLALFGPLGIAWIVLTAFH